MRAKRTGKPTRLMVEALEDRTAPALLTQQLLDINQNTLDAIPTSSTNPLNRIGAQWVEYNGAVYFTANDRPPGYDDAGTELWKSDGTVAGTVLVKDICPGFYGSYPSNLTVSGGILYF